MVFYFHSNFIFISEKDVITKLKFCHPFIHPLPRDEAFTKNEYSASKYPFKATFSLLNEDYLQNFPISL